ncbi:MAG: VOC family protein [Acidobacteriota bacterium]
MSPTLQHAVHWFEIPVSDMDRSVAFYEHILGVSLRREVISGMTLAVFPASEDGGVKGCLMAVDKVAPHVDGVLLYLNAGASVNAVLDRVQAQGGRVLTPRVQLPDGMGCFAHFTDPDGQRIGIHAMD